MMRNKRKFRYTWNQHLREGIEDQYRGAVGSLKTSKASQMPTTCDTKALSDPELEPTPEILQNVDEKGLTYYVSQLTCQLVDGDVAGVTEFFKDAGEGGALVDLLEKATGFSKTSVSEFFSLADATVPYIRPSSAVTENVPNPEFRARVAQADAEKQASSEESPPIRRELIQKYMEEQLDNLFNRIGLPHLKFILGNAMIAYWRKVIEEDTMGLAGDKALARNARTIAEIQIDWLTTTLGAIKSKVTLEPSDYDVDVYKAASWEPEVVKLAPALLKTISVEKFGQIYSQLLNKSPYAQTLIKAGKLSPWRAVEYEIQQAASGAQATDHSGLAMMISRLGENDGRYRKHFMDLLQREYPDFAFDPKLINRPDPEKASQEKAAYAQNWADILNQKLGTDKRKRSQGNNRLTEQNQRWKYLAGIK